MNFECCRTNLPRNFLPVGGREVIRNRVSVITTCWNAEKTLARAITGVRRQNYPDIEHIVVDACSSDRSVELIESPESGVSLWLSANDRGIADGFNRGLALASGEYIAICNADDFWGPDHLTVAISCLSDGGDISFGDILRFDEESGEAYRMVAARRLSVADTVSWPPEFNHPSMVSRSDVYRRVGGFDPKYKICMDYDWLIRALKAGFLPIRHDKLTVAMRCGGAADRNLQLMLTEIENILIENGTRPSIASARCRVARLKASVRSSVAEKCGPGVANWLRSKVNASCRPVMEGQQRFIQEFLNKDKYLTNHTEWD